MSQRLINFLGLIGYLNSDHALKTGDMGNAASYLKVFKMADPQNPDCAYLDAIFYMKIGNSQQAISSLNEAAALGFCDISQLLAEPVFDLLQNDQSYKIVVSKVRVNVSK